MLSISARVLEQTRQPMNTAVNTYCIVYNSKNFNNTSLQTSKFIVSLPRYFKLCFCTQGLRNSVHSGQYCTVSNILKVGVCALTSILTKALCFNGRDGAEYNSLTVNNVRRFYVHGFLTSRSPHLRGKVL